ncbi:MAG: Crp/Fnr family transcriptional regulator [Croceivirga sp.]
MGNGEKEEHLVAYIQNFEKHIVLTDIEKEMIASYLKFWTVPRREVVLSQGNKVKDIFFVVSGAIRAYHLDSKGKESTIMFAVKDWWITDMNGFAHQDLAQVSLETLKNSNLIALGYEDFEVLLKRVPKLERFFRILFQRAYIREQSRMLRQLSMDVSTRYTAFVEKYPNIMAAIPQKQMASYLGVTPEFLSQVKKRYDS